MKLLWFVMMWRWHARRGKWFAHLSSNHYDAAARYREHAYADGAAHAERVEMMQRRQSR